MPRLLVALADPHPEVRGSAAFALGQFSEFLQPDILTHYEQVIPAVLSLLKDSTDEVQERALYGTADFYLNRTCHSAISLLSKPDFTCVSNTAHFTHDAPGGNARIKGLSNVHLCVFMMVTHWLLLLGHGCCAALDVFCENLDPPEVLPYMPQVMEQLLMVLQRGSPGAQECCLSAISSMATASQSAFQPYTGQFRASSLTVLPLCLPVRSLCMHTALPACQCALSSMLLQCWREYGLTLP